MVKWQSELVIVLVVVNNVEIVADGVCHWCCSSEHRGWKEKPKHKFLWFKLYWGCLSSEYYHPQLNVGRWWCQLCYYIPSSFSTIVKIVLKKLCKHCIFWESTLQSEKCAEKVWLVETRFDKGVCSCMSCPLGPWFSVACGENVRGHLVQTRSICSRDPLCPDSDRFIVGSEQRKVFLELKLHWLQGQIFHASIESVWHLWQDMGFQCSTFQ